MYYIIPLNICFSFQVGWKAALHSRPAGKSCLDLESEGCSCMTSEKPGSPSLLSSIQILTRQEQLLDQVTALPPHNIVTLKWDDFSLMKRFTQEMQCINWEHWWESLVLFAIFHGCKWWHKFSMSYPVLETDQWQKDSGIQSYLELFLILLLQPTFPPGQTSAAFDVSCKRQQHQWETVNGGLIFHCSGQGN